MKKLILLSICLISIVALGLSQQVMNYKVEEQVQFALTQLPPDIQIQHQGIESTGKLNEAKIHKPIVLYKDLPIVEMDGDLVIKTHENEIGFRTTGTITLRQSETRITHPIAFTMKKESDLSFSEMNTEELLSALSLVELEIGQGVVSQKVADKVVIMTELDQFVLKITRDHLSEFNDLVKFQTNIKNFQFPGISPEVLKEIVNEYPDLFKNIDPKALNDLFTYSLNPLPKDVGNVNLKMTAVVNYPNQNAMQEAPSKGDDAKSFEWLASHGYFAEVIVEDLSDRTSAMNGKLTLNYQFENNPRLNAHLDWDTSVNAHFNEVINNFFDYHVSRLAKINNPGHARLLQFYYSYRREILDLIPQLDKAGNFKLKSDLNIELDLNEYDLLVDYNINYSIEKLGYEFDVKGDFKPSPFKSNQSDLDLKPAKMTLRVKNHLKLIEELVEWVNRTQKVFVHLTPEFQAIAPEQVGMAISILNKISDHPQDNVKDISFTIDYNDPNNLKIGDMSFGPIGNLK